MIEEEQTHRNFFAKRPGKPLLYDLPEHDGGHKDGGGLSWGRASGKTGAGAGRDHGGLRPGLDGGAFLAGRDGKNWRPLMA